MTSRRSIQRDLSRGITVTALILVLISGLVSGIIAFYEARDLQDHILQEIASMVTRGQLHDISLQRTHTTDEEPIVIRVLDGQAVTTGPNIPDNIPDGLQTHEIEGEGWRVLALTQSPSNRRIAIAQQTELRDEIAWATGLSVFLPVLLLIVLMLLLIRTILRDRFKPLIALSNRLDKQVCTDLSPLPDKGIPEEIAPFVASINALLERTRQAMEKQQRFIADAAHELRTPVTALSLLAENVEHASSDSDRRKRQSLLRQGLDRLCVLINQLLDLARVQSDFDSSAQPVSFNRIVQNSIAELHPLAEAGQVDLGLTRQEPIALMDRDGRLSQLVRNAIENAIRYTREGGTVDISLTSEAGQAVFCVLDTGVGIPEDELELIMQPFYRTQRSLQPGNGLGLAISQEIAQRLGGTIEISNRPEGGVNYRYRQPIAPADVSASRKDPNSAVAVAK